MICWLLLLFVRAFSVAGVLCVLDTLDTHGNRPPPLHSGWKGPSGAPDAAQVCFARCGRNTGTQRVLREFCELLAFALILAYLRYTIASVVTQRKLIRLIDNNLVKLHWLALLITSSVISYKRNC